MSGTVAERLAEGLVASLDGAKPPRHTLLWFDPDAEFKRLVPAMAKAFPPSVEVMTYQSPQSQIALKLQLLRRESSNLRTIVYLPDQAPRVLAPAGPRGEERPTLWALADYRYKGTSWVSGGESDSTATSLIRWLEQNGAHPELGRDGADLVAGGGDSALARYVAMHADTDPARWPRPLRADDIRAGLSGDPTESALLLLASARTAAAQWGERTRDVVDAIAAAYGATADSELTSVAESLVTALALTDAWDTFGRRDDFPFSAALPVHESQRARSLKLLREDVLRRQDVAPRYHAFVKKLNAKRAAIGPWASGMPGQPLGMAGLASDRVRHLLGSLSASTPDARVESVHRLHAAVASWPSDRTAWPEVMTAVAAATELLEEIEVAGAALGALHDASLLVEAYAAIDGWNRIDRHYLRLVAAAAGEPSLAPLRGLVDHEYVAWIASANDRFAKLVEAEDAWPPPQTELAPPPEWSADHKHRRAVLVTDAMRLDLAHAVRDRLADAVLQSGLSTLPTTTPFGMAALLPHAGVLTAELAKGGVVLREGASTAELQTRAGRKEWLSAQLSAQGQSVAFVELTDLLGGYKLKPADLTVVFDYRLDDAGHGQGSVPDEIDGQVARLSRAVRRLHELGVGSVDVVTDHGFLHQPPDLVEALGKPPVAPAQVFQRAARYAVVKPDAPLDSLIRLRSSLVPDLNLGFARGIRTLEKPAEYMHGGISLQECVIGRIRSTRTLESEALGVAVTVPSTQLATGTVAVQVAPQPGEQMTLATPPPRRLRMWVSDGSATDVSDRLECEIRSDAPTQTLALYLHEGRAMPAGTTLRLSVVDGESGEALHDEDLTLLVDWE